jgi:hypothetical protein
MQLTRINKQALLMITALFLSGAALADRTLLNVSYEPGCVKT